MRSVIALALAILAVAGCSGDDSPAADSSTPRRDAPAKRDASTSSGLCLTPLGKSLSSNPGLVAQRTQQDHTLSANERKTLAAFALLAASSDKSSKMSRMLASPQLRARVTSVLQKYPSIFGPCGDVGSSSSPLRVGSKRAAMKLPECGDDCGEIVWTAAGAAIKQAGKELLDHVIDKVLKQPNKTALVTQIEKEWSATSNIVQSVNIVTARDAEDVARALADLAGLVPALAGPAMVLKVGILAIDIAKTLADAHLEYDDCEGIKAKLDCSDAGPDTGAPDAGADQGTDATDSGPDADAAADTGSDAAPDANADATSDMPADGATSDSTVDAAADAGADIGPDTLNLSQCGNNRWDPGTSEQCDGADLRGTCITAGFMPGTLKCTTKCQWDTSACGPPGCPVGCRASNGGANSTAINFDCDCSSCTYDNVVGFRPKPSTGCSGGGAAGDGGAGDGGSGDGGCSSDAGAGSDAGLFDATLSDAGGSGSCQDPDCPVGCLPLKRAYYLVNGSVGPTAGVTCKCDPTKIQQKLPTCVADCSKGVFYTARWWGPGIPDTSVWYCGASLALMRACGPVLRHWQNGARWIESTRRDGKRCGEERRWFNNATNSLSLLTNHCSGFECGQRLEYIDDGAGGSRKLQRLTMVNGAHCGPAQGFDASENVTWTQTISTCSGGTTCSGVCNQCQ